MGIARHGPGASIASEGQVPGEARIFDQSPALAGRLKQAALKVTIMSMITRNDPLGFASFAWKNFEFIEQAAEHNDEIHPVTQLALALLGLIVFQHEKNRKQFDARVRGKRIVDLNWPLWNVSEPSTTLGQFVKQLRHAVAHGGVQFSSNSHVLTEVEITFHDPQSNWTGSIRASELREFCYQFKTLLEQTAAN